MSLLLLLAAVLLGVVCPLAILAARGLAARGRSSGSGRLGLGEPLPLLLVACLLQDGLDLVLGERRRCRVGVLEQNGSNRLVEIVVGREASVADV